MRFILAAEDGAVPLLLSRSEGSERGTELLDFAPVFRPVAGALRGDCAVVMRLSLSKQIAGRA